MKKIVAILILFLIFSMQTTSFADEPPAWYEFTVSSDNKEYFADVTKAKKDSLKSNWDSQWDLTVYRIEAGDSTEIWNSIYEYDGYHGGSLSDDGQIFVYVNEWYYADHAIVKIYNAGDSIIGIKGIDFNVLMPYRIKTVSHELWLSRDPGSVKFVNIGSEIFLNINTIDYSSHLIDCKSGSISTRRNIIQTIVFYSAIIIIIISMAILFRKLKTRYNIKK